MIAFILLSALTSQFALASHEADEGFEHVEIDVAEDYLRTRIEGSIFDCREEIRRISNWIFRSENSWEARIGSRSLRQFLSLKDEKELVNSFRMELFVFVRLLDVIRPQVQGASSTYTLERLWSRATYLRSLLARAGSILGLPPVGFTGHYVAPSLGILKQQEQDLSRCRRNFENSRNGLGDSAVKLGVDPHLVNTLLTF